MCLFMLNWELFSQETVGQKLCKIKRGSVPFRVGKSCDVKMRDEGQVVQRKLKSQFGIHKSILQQSILLSKCSIHMKLSVKYMSVV